VLLDRPVMVLRELITTPYELDVVSRGRDAPLRLLLEDVKHVDHPWKLHGVDSAIRAAVVILDEFRHTGATKALERLRYADDDSKSAIARQAAAGRTNVWEQGA